MAQEAGRQLHRGKGQSAQAGADAHAGAPRALTRGFGADEVEHVLGRAIPDPGLVVVADYVDLLVRGLDQSDVLRLGPEPDIKVVIARQQGQRVEPVTISTALPRLLFQRRQVGQAEVGRPGHGAAQLRSFGCGQVRHQLLGGLRRQIGRC